MLLRALLVLAATVSAAVAPGRRDGRRHEGHEGGRRARRMNSWHHDDAFDRFPPPPIYYPPYGPVNPIYNPVDPIYGPVNYPVNPIFNVNPGVAC